MIPRVLLDTNVFKFSASGPLCFIPVNRKTRNWYGRVTGVQLYDIGYVNRNEKIRNPELKREVDLLPQIAELAKQNHLELVAHPETTYESWGLPAMGSPTGPFYGAPISEAESPIKHERFQKLARLTGGYQGSNQHNLNQLLDAFYIWCAEHNKCQYLLTLDFKLIRVIRNNKQQDLDSKLVKPSELLRETGHQVKEQTLFSRTMSIAKRLLGY
jgi:hypothetical protein